MRRIILSSLLAAVSAALVLAPSAFAKGKPLPPSITKVSISGLPKEGESCPISTTVEYSGKAAHGDYAVTVFEPSGKSGGSHPIKKSPVTYTDSFAVADVTGSTDSFKVRLFNKDNEVLSEVKTSSFGLSGTCFPEGKFSSYPFVGLTISPALRTGTSAEGASAYLFFFSSGAGQQTFTVTNNGSLTSEPLELHSGEENAAEGLTSANNNCDGKALAPGATCTFEVKSAPPTSCEEGEEFEGIYDLVGKETLVTYLHMEVIVECPEEPV